MDQNSVLDLINGNVYGIWYLVGAALVFFMQCGFAMVEAGFTRAKNAGNIIMKNLMDFCLGTVVFILIGFGILCGEDLAGIIGKPGFDIFSDYANFDWSSFVFNLVFCATAATIVSGAMAERTKFISYCIYSAVISAVIYPVETHWVWGGGWLSQLSTPFHDFAGSGVIHMVGGVSALIGAAILGPRIGKFTKTKDGKVKVTDFGIAKAATSNTITSNVMGSVHYTSPEQARGGYSDEKSDIYSMGITLFEMLTGRVPFNGETTVAIAIKHIQEEMPSPREYVPEIPVCVEQIVLKCTQKSPDRRYHSMAALIADLKKALMSPDEDFEIGRAHV